METWDLQTLKLRQRLPEILSSTDEARVLALDLAEGESLAEHEVHERCWIVVLAGEVSVTSSSGGSASGGVGLLIELSPGERHSVSARSDSRLLLLLAPWPGNGHPGAMSIREKLYVRRHASKG